MSHPRAPDLSSSYFSFSSSVVSLCLSSLSFSFSFQECFEFLRSVIFLSFPSSSSPAPSSSHAHSIHAVSTSTTFSRNVPLASILAAVTWSSFTFFTSFYLRDVQFSSSSGFSLGPVVAADAVISCLFGVGCFSFACICFMVSASAWEAFGLSLFMQCFSLLCLRRRSLTWLVAHYRCWPLYPW